MIEIKNIYAGWLTFEFHYGEVSQLFTVSYLNDFRDDMDYLLGINRNGEHKEYIYKYQNGMESRAITLDGEGTILKLSIMKEEFEEQIVITWWLNDDIPVSMVFGYSSFVESYLKEMDRIGEENYKKDFLMEYEREE